MDMDLPLLGESPENQNWVSILEVWSWVGYALISKMSVFCTAFYAKYPFDKPENSCIAYSVPQETVYPAKG